ncbi:MAG: hypothetical protein JWP36_1731 [Paucimonas sp.]|jgi:hypothetical protein|nr:hypothetical protein [Paucimonas sp.]
MDIVLIELILWGALIFFFWALRENLGNVETELEQAQTLKAREFALRALQRRFVLPERLSQPIGQYRGVPIHELMVFDGRHYRFDHVCPPEDHPLLREEHCYVEPGLVYVRCEPVATHAAA